MENLNSSGGLPPAIYLTHSYSDVSFLYGAGFICFIVFVCLSLMIYVTTKNYKDWHSGAGVLNEVSQRSLRLMVVMLGPIAVCSYLMFLSRSWSVTIGMQGVRVTSPLNLLDRGGVIAWSEVEKGRIVMGGKHGGLPYISLKGHGSHLFFPIWEMSHEDAQLTCQMVFSKLNDSQLTQSRQALSQLCTHYRSTEGWLASGVQLKRLTVSTGE